MPTHTAKPIGRGVYMPATHGSQYFVKTIHCENLHHMRCVLSASIISAIHSHKYWCMCGGFFFATVQQNNGLIKFFNPRKKKQQTQKVSSDLALMCVHEMKIRTYKFQYLGYM